MADIVFLCSEKASDWLPDEQQKQAKHTSKQ